MGRLSEGETRELRALWRERIRRARRKAGLDHHAIEPVCPDSKQGKQFIDMAWCPLNVMRATGEPEAKNWGLLGALGLCIEFWVVVGTVVLYALL